MPRYAAPDTAALPWAADRPPWSGPHPSQIGETYGTLFAFPAAEGAFALYHDLAQEFHAMTVRYGMGDCVELYSRRWHVQRADLKTQGGN